MARVLVKDTNPVAVVLPYAGSTAPTGWLLCDGSPVSRTVYASLFASIGITYGSGDGLSTFNLPDMRGIFVRGAGSQTIGAETYSATLGTKQNDATSVNGLATTSSGAHTHGPWYGAGSGATSDSPDGSNGNPMIASTIYSNKQEVVPSTNSAHTHILSGDSETRPANLALNYIIKA